MTKNEAIKQAGRERWLRKFPNRRLYCPVEKRYITLQEVAARIKAGDEVKVFERVTERDITSYVYLQILVGYAEHGDVRFTELELRERIQQATANRMRSAA